MTVAIDKYGTELTAVMVLGNPKLKANQMYGRVKVNTFTLATGDGLAENGVVALTTLPFGARILGGRIDFGAMGQGATADIGLVAKDGLGYIDADSSVADDIDMLGDGLDVAAASQLNFADTAARNMLYETERECYVAVKAVGAAFAASKTLQGYILYSVD